MKTDLIIIDCWNTLFYTDLPKHHFKVFFEVLGLDFGDYETLKVFEKVFFLQKQMEYESAVHLFCEINEIRSYDVHSLSQVLYDGLNHNNCYHDTIDFLERVRQHHNGDMREQVKGCETITRMDAGAEPTGMYSRRVSKYLRQKPAEYGVRSTLF